MNCPWFENNMFYIMAPGILLPCCNYPVLDIIIPEKEQFFYQKYSMLYLKNNSIENILENKNLISMLIDEMKQTHKCELSLCNQFKNNIIKSNLYDFQIMLTTKCNLMCLACLRNIRKKYVHNFHWDFDINEFKKQFNPSFLQRINSIQFTGSIGDAIFYPKLLSLLHYISKFNNNISITIHTNGNYHLSGWWKFLVKELSFFKYYTFIFSIDGLETYNIYRVNGNLQNVLNNAKTFINFGGKATWKYIKMKHNEYEIDTAKKLSEKMGFYEFNIVEPWRIQTEHDIYNQNNY